MSQRLLIVASVMALAACSHRGTRVYEVPEGFSGWAAVVHGVPGCPALPPSDEGTVVYRLPTSGVLCTRSPARDGDWGQDEFYFTGSSRREIPTAGPPSSRRIWSPGEGSTAVAGQTRKMFAFFVGTGAEHEANLRDLAVVVDQAVAQQSAGRITTR